ncbi:hypothetical protein PSTG_01671 [Puccinia striiformis f. sp. tritici PST-78]|uniref:HAT C-terminal dimerisation domain-containing protein n=1 Tax=Puccinia striiformis f. sp. tritici PST-78 TaxID=1165861 RepID=A0A0L0W0R1_9BASI|nr:hypothetical protein PSTG_01671 [Puccinia striiformis f. sp. tritici PST-78]
MALDVLSCPATTVDVERAFSFGRDYVSFKRHRLSASSVTRGMTIAFHSKSGKIKAGTLRQVLAVHTRVPAPTGAGAGAGV